jgi:hypothetical protein
VARSNHNKTEKRPVKIILWWRHHLRFDVAVRKEKSLCRRADEVVDAVVVVLIFKSAAMEKTIPSYPASLPEKRRRR